MDLASGVVRARVRRSTYADSVTLMLLAQRLRELPGVRSAAAQMGTPANRALLAEAGLLAPEVDDASPGDLCLVVAADDDAAAAAALAAADHIVHDAPDLAGAAAGAHVLRSLEGALRHAPDTSLALISVPGPFAAAEAWTALRRGLHVFLFSDHVSLDDEVLLKEEARRQGRLLMGPDCGTAIVAGVPLGFANRVPRGPVGIVGSSGTGIQEVACLLARWGVGVSHALGSGSRDLHPAVGGITTRQAMDLLLGDPATRVVVWIGKAAAGGAAEALADWLADAPVPVVVALQGGAAGAPRLDRRGSLHPARTLAEAAQLAAQLAARLAGGGPGHDPTDVPLPDALLPSLRALAPGQRRLEGIYSGGTLAAEAAAILADVAGEPTLGMPGALLAADRCRVVDYGDDAYTRGRPHPMLDPALRQEAIRAAGRDPATGVVLLDVILGFGAAPDPGGPLAAAVRGARSEARARGGDLVCIASVCGTDDDTPAYGAQRAALEEAGVLVAPSNATAAEWARSALQELPA